MILIHVIGLKFSCCVLIIVFLHSMISTRSVSSQPFGLDCPQNNTFYDPNANPAFPANLNSLFSDLSSNSSLRQNGFYNSSAGGVNPSDTVYGLFLCRPDASTDACEECVTTAINEIQEQCPNRTRATSWYDLCMLRYSNQSIFSRLDRSFQVWAWNTEDAPEPESFSQVLQNMLRETANEAANRGSNEKFAVLEDRYWSENGKSVNVYGLAQCTPDLSTSDCEECLSAALSRFRAANVSYKRGGRFLSPSCNARFEFLRFYNFSDESQTTAPVPDPGLPAPAPDSGRSRRSRGVVIAITLPICVSIVLFIVSFLFLVRRRRRRSWKRYNSIAEVGKDFSTDHEFLHYSLSQIRSATNNFSADQKIGEGGFGPVHKGTLPNGQEIAVKRLSRSSAQGAEEFKNEIQLVAKLQHRNLVRLLGFSFDEEEKILVYEFVPNRSLDYFLFDPGKQQMLKWLKRYKIIGGIARGLLYLHEDSRLRIIHRDLKASNVLLDANMDPKIADFGMARIFGVDQAEGNTNRIAGTFGYMAPEYAMHGQFSVKSDVFSFGVLTLEIVSGKKNSSFYQSDGAKDLLSYAWKHWRDGTPLTLLDPSIAESSAKNEVMQCIHIGLLCVQEDVEQRPTMASVVHMMNSVSVTLPTPHQPAFFVRNHSRTESIPLETESSDRSIYNTRPESINEASISVPVPR